MSYANFLRWIYRSGHPNAVGRVMNRVGAVLSALGLMPNYAVQLTVIGRRTGRPISFPLVMAVVDGERYLVSMLGTRAAWVHNLRAANMQATLHHGKTESVFLEEVPIEQRPRILKTYLRLAPGARPHIPVDPNAPLEAFAAIAAQFPVFRVLVADPPANEQGGQHG